MVKAKSAKVGRRVVAGAAWWMVAEASAGLGGPPGMSYRPGCEAPPRHLALAVCGARLVERWGSSSLKGWEVERRWLRGSRSSLGSLKAWCRRGSRSCWLGLLRLSASALSRIWARVRGGRTDEGREAPGGRPFKVLGQSGPGVMAV